MKEQMSMFEDGGLLDEGGSIDPVSGNDVPPGSTQEEVRDDIPAQLSEGEFVFPADVVRFIGLGNLMQIRQQAKMGLKQMEAMGQMGNSDEATMPDDLPFDINDLDMEDDGVVEFADGGLAGPNSNTGVYFNPALPQQQTGYISAPPVQAASSTYQAPQQYVTPTVQQAVPEFQSFIQPTEGMKPEVRKYINSATGEEISITFINNQPTTPIPTGYVPASEYIKPETVKTETVTAPTTSVQQSESNGEVISSDTKEFGGNVNARKDSDYAKMVGKLGFYQFSSLSPVVAVATDIGGKASPNQIATSINQARAATVAALGYDNLADVSRNDLSLLAESMKRAEKATTKDNKIPDVVKIAEKVIAEQKKKAADYEARKAGDIDNRTADEKIAEGLAAAREEQRREQQREEGQGSQDEASAGTGTDSSGTSGAGTEGGVTGMSDWGD